MIRPVEMQMLLPRTESVGNVQQHENQRVVNENTFAANEVAREVKHNSETVIRKDGNKLTDYQYDAKEEGNGTYENPRKRKQKQDKRNGETADSELTNEEIENNKQPRVNIQI
ncbi:MAG: hypothetical protein PUC12_14800 [Clostridiales bacterium]|nr:hypothetical protein [Clostridiales bacterium]